jgi:hypothetical protein
MLIYVVVHCGIVAAEIEADYMWDLINPAVMNTEGGYYLICGRLLVFSRYSSFLHQ